MTFDARKSAKQAVEKIENSPSALIKLEADHILKILRPAASRNTTGPAAVVSRRISGRLKKALARIRGLEVRLEKSQIGSAQDLLKKEIGGIIDAFVNEAAWDWIDLRIQMANESSAFERLSKKLPEWFKKLVDQSQKRKGISLGRAPGALRPFNQKNVTGERREEHFRGEVIKYQALPEKQREGLRPDGLEWIFKF